MKCFIRSCSSLSAIIFLCYFLTECSDSTGPKIEPYGANTVVYNVEYQPNVFIFSGEKKKALLEVDSTGTYFTFDESKIDTFPPDGSILIIDGEYARKIKSSYLSGNKVIFETENALIPEIIKNGKIAWDFTPDIGKLQSIWVNDKEIKRHRITGDGYEYKFELGNWKFTVWMNPKGTSAEGLPELQVNFTCENSEGAGGAVTSVLGAKGTTRLPRQTTNLDVANSSVTNFTTNTRSMRSELSLEYVATFSAGGGNVDLSLPKITLRIPIQSLTSLPIPLPIYINLGLAFFGTVNVPSVTATAMSKCKLIMDSNTGFEFQGANIKPTYTVNDKKLEDIDWDVGDMSISPAPVEMRYDVHCPRVGIEFMETEVAWMSSVFSSRTKLMIPSLCKATMSQVRMEGGYSFGLFGFSIAEDKILFFEVSKEEKTSDCP